MGRVKDLTGMKFGRLTVIERRGSDKRGNAMWLCKCECGNETIVRGDNLRNGRTTSCGCYNSELSSKKFKEKWKDEEFRQMKSNEMREMVKEKWQDEEYRQMKSEQRKKMNEEMWQDEDFRQMQSDKAKEQWEDEEFRQMMSNKFKEKWNDEEFRQMQSELSSKKLKEKWQDEEFRQMQSEQMKEQWKDEEFRQMMSNKMKQQWENEEMKWKRGYKGGISPISIYLRSLPVVKEWRKNTYTRENNKCQLTGKHVHGGNSDVHHLHSFNMIVLEAHELHNIQVKPQVKDYTEEELHKLEEYVAGLHKDGSNAVLLSEEVHSLFHSIYKYGNNTPEQFEEFKQRYLSGEFNI